MSFADQETSRDRGEPILLYLFRYGEPAGAVIAYTDGEEDRVFDDGVTGPITYKSIAIDCESVKVSGTLDKAAITVHTSDDAELADRFRLYPPSYVVTLTIRQGHANDPDEQFLAGWVGRVIGFATTKENTAQYTCEPISTSLRRAGLRRRWQYGCPHVLYGQGPNRCNADEAAATHAQVALAVDGAIVSFDPAWATDPPKEKFLGGMAKWTTTEGLTEIRTIIQVGDDGSVTLSGYANGLEAGASVNLVLGCNHKAGIAAQPDGDCGPLHNNIQNFGGQPWIPTKNPFGLRNIYY